MTSLGVIGTVLLIAVLVAALHDLYCSGRHR